MTAGEGGIIITDDDDFERLARSAHDCGRLPGEWFYSHFSYGSNYRLSEWQGAVLLAQLSRLDEQTACRHANGRLLDWLLSDIPGIGPQSHDSRITRNGQYAYIFPLRQARLRRGRHRSLCRGIGSGRHSHASALSALASAGPVHEPGLIASG